MKCKYLILLASMGFAALLNSASPALAQVSLGAAEAFAVLGGTAVTCTDSTVGGDVGVNLGGAITQTNCTTTGTVHLGDTVAQRAYHDFLVAYDALASKPCDVNLTGQPLAGKSLTPGVYCFDAAVTETGGQLTLNGPADGIWIFKIGILGTGALTGTNFSVVMPGGAVCNNNVFWWTAEAATLTDSVFLGSILAGTSITVTRGSFDGQALAKVAVTLTGTSVCGGTPGGALPQVDHYKCYTAQQKSPKQQQATITLQDSFDSKPEQVVVDGLDGMCNPVSKNNEQIVQRQAHLKSYEFKKHGHDNGDDEGDNDGHNSLGTAIKNDGGDDDGDNDFKKRTVVVKNQFGKEELRIGNREKLLVPSSKSVIPPALPGADPGPPPRFIDHYKCYQAEHKRHVIEVTLEDQFLREKVSVGDAQLFCNPVKKDHAGVVTGILPRLPGTPDRLVCYELKSQKRIEKLVNMRDQFANAVLKVERSETLCVPSTLLDVHQ